jgi:hypothetical protein
MREYIGKPRRHTVTTTAQQTHVAAQAQSSGRLRRYRGVASGSQFVEQIAISYIDFGSTLRVRGQSTRLGLVGVDPSMRVQLEVETATVGTEMSALRLHQRINADEPDWGSMDLIAQLGKYCTNIGIDTLHT